jgi:hypothetical protein
VFKVPILVLKVLILVFKVPILVFKVSILVRGSWFVVRGSRMERENHARQPKWLPPLIRFGIWDCGFRISDFGFERQPPRPSATPPDQEGSF